MAEAAGDNPRQLPSETQGVGCRCAHHHTLLARWLAAWQARDDASQRAQAAGSCPDNIFVGRLPKPQDLGSMMPADQAPTR